MAVVLNFCFGLVYFVKIQNIATVLKRAPGAFYIANGKRINDIEFISDSILALTGYSPHLFSRKAKGLDHIIADDDKEKFFKVIRHALAEDNEFFCISCRGIRKDKSSFFLENVGHIVKLNNGKTKIIGILEDVSDRVSCDAEIQRQMKEKDILLKEIHHRVKNNLAMISSLINLQMDTVKTKSAKAALRTFQNRISSILLVHQRLYKDSGISVVNIEEYLSDLADNLLFSLSPGRGIRLDTSFESYFLDLDRTVPLGMIASEILTNALKHGFRNCSKGVLKVEFFQDNNKFFLQICDNGNGFPKDIGKENNKSLGTQLINILTGQLNGEVSFCCDSGWSCVRVSFPVYVENRVLT